MNEREEIEHNKIAGDLCNYLCDAMYEFPGIPVTTIIEEALDFKYPTRKNNGSGFYASINKDVIPKKKRWKFTNEEIAEALRVYVKMRRQSNPEFIKMKKALEDVNTAHDTENY